jgi:hypothetical protein
MVITALHDPQRTTMLRTAAIALALVVAGAAAQAVPTVAFDPAVNSVVVGDVFHLDLQGSSFDRTSGGLVIGNFTGGQNLRFSYTSASLEVVAIAIAPRWTFTTGNRSGSVDAGAGTVSGVAFGVFPATTDDDFDILRVTLKALAPGRGSIALLAGQFIGQVGGLGGQLIVPTFGSASIDIAAVPEPQSWALLLAGLGLIGFVARRR